MEPSDCIVSLKPCLLLTAILSGIALNLEYGLVYGGESVNIKEIINYIDDRLSD